MISLIFSLLFFSPAAQAQSCHDHGDGAKSSNEQAATYGNGVTLESKPLSLQEAVSRNG
jgi:hypothetical protein